MRKILPFVLATLTNHPRYLPEIVWSDKSWTHNVFRVYELIFFRRVGIRKEATYSNDGYVKIYTFEALCAYMETQVRSFKLPKFKMVWVPVLQPVYAGFGMEISSGPRYVLAIARDVTASQATNQSTFPYTYSHTVTGSSPLIIVAPAFSGNSVTDATCTAVSYNSVAATQATQNTFDTGSSNVVGGSLWIKGSCSTGANNVSVSGGTAFISASKCGSTSYSGCQSSSVADAANNTTGNTSGAKTVSVTVVGTGCWIYNMASNAAAGVTLTATQSQRFNNAASSPANGGEDTNGTVSAGANSTGWTVGGTGLIWVICAASFAPDVSPPATVQPLQSLLMLGVG